MSGFFITRALEEDFRPSVRPAKEVQKAEQLIALSSSLRHKPWQIPEP